MDIGFRSVALASLLTLTADIQSKFRKLLSWLPDEQGPTFLDYRVAPFVLEPQPGYVFQDETYWVIYVLAGQEFQIVNVEAPPRNPTSKRPRILSKRGSQTRPSPRFISNKPGGVTLRPLMFTQVYNSLIFHVAVQTLTNCRVPTTPGSWGLTD